MSSPQRAYQVVARLSMLGKHTTFSAATLQTCAASAKQNLLDKCSWGLVVYLKQPKIINITLLLCRIWSRLRQIALTAPGRRQ